MKRRDFINSMGAGIATPILLNGIGLSIMPRSSLSSFINSDNDRVLVLIQLIGGNDGLNTIVPIDQYAGLAAVRPNIVLPQKELLSISDKVGLHPSLANIHSLYQEGKMGIVQAVGYPNQNRSHFRSTDIWTTASPADQVWSSGWLGRYFENSHAAYPEGYPNDTFPDPFAITMGSIVTETCQGTATNFSLAVEDPFSLIELTDSQAGSEQEDEPYYDELNFLKQTISQTNAYSRTIFDAAEKGGSRATYPDTRLARQFKNVATLISGGLRTKVYLVSIGGFDTHADQVVESNIMTGEHAELLNTLSEAVKAFQTDLQQLGLEERVLGVTFSEFGRRIRSNDSLGTDHGTAAPLMLFGSCVNSQILGENPEIDKEVDKKAGVPMQFDFRDVYGSILTDWFEVPAEDVRNILQHDYEHLPVIGSCSVTTPVDNFSLEPVSSKVFPNPFKEMTTIDFHSDGERVHLTIFDAVGSRIKVLVDQTLPAGQHQINFDARPLAAGSYFYRLQIGRRVTTKSMLKL